jgi:hypothetical protein
MSSEVQEFQELLHVKKKPENGCKQAFWSPQLVREQKWRVMRF